MGEDEIIVLIVFSFIFGTVIISKLIGLAKTWVEGNNSAYDEEKFDRLAKAFIQHKKESERRFQNLEAIVTDDEPRSTSSSKKELKETQLHNTIEIDNDNDTDESDKQKRNKSGSGNLRNMLKE